MFAHKKAKINSRLHWPPCKNNNNNNNVRKHQQIMFLDDGTSGAIKLECF